MWHQCVSTCVCTYVQYVSVYFSGALRTDCASNCAIILGFLCAVFPLLLEIVTV